MANVVRNFMVRLGLLTANCSWAGANGRLEGLIAAIFFFPLLLNRENLAQAAWYDLGYNAQSS